MLRLISASSPDEKKVYFCENSSLDHLWIVSHMEAKKWLQDQFLRERESIPTQTVLRATEYWQWLFSINIPDWRVVSESLIYALIEEWFEENKTAAQFSDIEMFYNFIVQMAPLLFSGQEALFEDWLVQDPERARRLKPWWEQIKAFSETLNQKKWVGRPWMLSLLSTREELYVGEPQKIYFDLGLDLKHEEVDLILRLSQNVDVIVMVPAPPWDQKDLQISSVYQRLGEASMEPLPPLTKDLTTQVCTQHTSSVLQEVKQVVAQVRGWLNQGVAREKIGICSPVIEDYWPLLHTHFAIEGVPVHKRLVMRAISLPQVQVWLARLQLLKEDFSQSSLEATLYFDDFENHLLPYADFKKNFSQTYDAKELRHFFKLQEPYQKQKVLNLGEFVDILYAQWGPEGEEILSEIIDRLVKDLNLQDQLSFAIWLKYLELVLSRYEITVRREQEDGIRFANLNAADWLDVSHLLFLGCEQKHLIQTQRTPLKMEDLFSIERDLGFYLQKTESHKSEFDLLWCLEKRNTSFYLFHSETDFNGDPQLASHTWLQKNLAQAKNNLESESQRTRWDEIMNSSLEKILTLENWTKEEQVILLQKMNQEMSLDHFQKLVIKEKPRLSAGQLQKFDQCAFQFFAEKVLNLKAQQAYDLEVDPMYNGQVLHSLLEHLIKRYPSLHVQREDLEKLYEEVLQTMDADLPLQRFWRNEKHRQLNLVQNFIELEKSYRAEHPGVSTTGTEVLLSGYLTALNESVQLSLEKVDESSYPFLGKIDRLDVDSKGTYGIIDYKTSQSSSMKSFSSWLENSQFQMSLYALAVEEGLAEPFVAGDVSTAEYVFLKNKKRGSGFIVAEDNSEFLGLTEKQKTISQVQKQEHLEELKAKIFQIIKQMEGGFFPPKPKETKICEHCHWSPLCRAPHLR
jgi:RecB family exonuclease